MKKNGAPKFKDPRPRNPVEKSKDSGVPREGVKSEDIQKETKITWLDIAAFSCFLGGGFAALGGSIGYYGIGKLPNKHEHLATVSITARKQKAKISTALEVLQNMQDRNQTGKTYEKSIEDLKKKEKKILLQN